MRWEICTDQAPFTSENSSKLNMYFDFDVREQQMDFFGGSIILGYGLFWPCSDSSLQDIDEL